MHSTRFVLAAGVGLFLPAASIQPARAQSHGNNNSGPQTQRPGRTEHDKVTGAIFSAEPDGQGNVRFAVLVDNFTLEKILASSGDALDGVPAVIDDHCNDVLVLREADGRGNPLESAQVVATSWQ